jgi:O-antigen/teichoic acid export membrane protein
VKKLLTVTIFSGLLTLLRMASGFVIAKVVAVHTGPTGLAMLGQVQSLFAAMNGIVASPVGTGVVRYTAENHEAGLEACAPWWRAALKWMLALLVIVLPTSCLFAQPIAQWALGDPDYAWLVVVTALALPLSATNSLIGSVINGRQEYKRFVGLSMLAVTTSTALMVVLILQAQLSGALLAAALFSGCSGLVMLIGSLKQPWFKLKYWWAAADKVQLKGVGGYVAMAFTSAITMPIALLFVRNTLVENVGWEQAGHWQAVYKISEVYLGVITIALSAYFLPKLATLKTAEAILNEIQNTIRLVLPIVIGLAIIVYFLRDIAIKILFTEAFTVARELFLLQLIGDVVKILSWLFAYPMLSHGATKWFIFTEITFSLSFALLTLILVPQYGVHGANIAYLANYFLYLIFIYTNVRRFTH